MKEQYCHLDKNNKLIWNFRDIGHTMRRISEGKGSQKRILILLWENKGMLQRTLTQRLGIQPGVGQRGHQQAGSRRIDCPNPQRD